MSKMGKSIVEQCISGIRKDNDSSRDTTLLLPQMNLDNSLYTFNTEGIMTDRKKFTEQELQERLKKGKQLTREEFIKRIHEASERKTKSK